MHWKSKTKIILIGVFLLFISPLIVSADTQGQVKTFFVDSSYDAQQREQISATLEKVSQNAYFYLEDEWSENLTESEKEKVDKNLITLSQEFDQKIYPELTSTYGSEWKPGIDNDNHITILFHQMKKNVGGYFNNGDEYPKVQNAISNEREMIYVNTDYLKYGTSKSYVAHEFTHLITFNQKERLRGVSEEIWLNEARAEYAPTLLGYDVEYQGSNLQQRVKQFIASPSDSLTEWQNQKADYGIINVFFQYLVDHYGVDILVDSLKSSQVGIPSLNYALKKAGVEEDFSQIFTDWTIAIFLNDCNVGAEYCYKNENLKNLRITPSLIFLPSTQRTEVSLNYFVKQWAGNWYRIMGGEGDLKLKFDGEDKVHFDVPYVLCQNLHSCSVNFLNLNEKQEGEILLEDFGSNWTSLTLIPSIQSKTSGFDGREPSYSFSLSVSMEMKTEKEKLIEELKAQIAVLQAQIAELQAKIAAILREKIGMCTFSANLYYGMRGNGVRCLQEFLKAQGKEIYPQGLVTGFFGPLTRAAVMRFQEKYASEILFPLGLKKGTGFVGPSTRNKINRMLNL
ncbi:peptidoglycan-binding protein [bacterium]|nr:peptidoglycan-binding protein [bacterium]